MQYQELRIAPHTFWLGKTIQVIIQFSAVGGLIAWKLL